MARSSSAHSLPLTLMRIRSLFINLSLTPLLPVSLCVCVCAMKAQGTVEAYMCLTLVSAQLYWISFRPLLLSPLPRHSPSLHFLLLLAAATSAAVVISVYLFTLEASNVFFLFLSTDIFPLFFLLCSLWHMAVWYPQPPGSNLFS